MSAELVNADVSPFWHVAVPAAAAVAVKIAKSAKTKASNKALASKYAAFVSPPGRVFWRKAPAAAPDVAITARASATVRDERTLPPKKRKASYYCH